MFPIKLIENTALVRFLGGPPVFIESVLKRLEMVKHTMTLEIELKSHNNPLLDQDTLVRMVLKKVDQFSLQKARPTEEVMVIHDLDIKKVGDTLRLRLESIDGMQQEIVFETIDIFPIE